MVARKEGLDEFMVLRWFNDAEFAREWKRAEDHYRATSPEYQAIKESATRAADRDWRAGNTLALSWLVACLGFGLFLAVQTMGRPEGDLSSAAVQVLVAGFVGAIGFFAGWKGGA